MSMSEQEINDSIRDLERQHLKNTREEVDKQYCQVTPKEIESIARELEEKRAANSKDPSPIDCGNKERDPFWDPDDDSRIVNVSIPSREYHRILRTFSDDKTPAENILHILRVHVRQIELDEYKKELQQGAAVKLQRRASELETELRGLE